MQEVKIDADVKEKVLNVARTVTQDICIEFHHLSFDSRSNRRRNNEQLIGDPTTLKKPYEIFDYISKHNYHLISWTRNKKRFVHTLEKIRFVEDKTDPNNLIIDLLFSCTDTEAQTVISKHSTERTRKTFNFEKDEGHEKLCHAVFLGKKDSHFGRLHLEAGQNTTANQISCLLQYLLKKISMLKENRKDSFFHEIYQSTLDTLFYIDYIPKVEPVPEENVVERLSKGEFSELVLEHKNLFSIDKKADFVSVSKQQVVFKPSPILKVLKNTRECLEQLNILSDKYAPNNKAKEAITVFKLKLKDGKRQKQIEIRPESATLESFGTKKHWLNGFERVQILTEENMYDDNLCRKLRALKIDLVDDLELDQDDELDLVDDSELDAEE